MFNRYESCQNREIWFDSIKEWDNVIHVIERMTKCIRIELCRVSYLDQRVQIVLGWLHIVQLRRSKSVVETGLLYQHMHARERAHKFKINCCAVNLLELRSFSNHSSSDRERRWEGRTDSPYSDTTAGSGSTHNLSASTYLPNNSKSRRQSRPNWDRNRHQQLKHKIAPRRFDNGTTQDKHQHSNFIF